MCGKINMEICEDLRQTVGMKELYDLRKETIERLVGTAKEAHNFRYTNMIGKARMQMKVGLTFACMNLKKLARIMDKRGLFGGPDSPNKAKRTIISLLTKIKIGFGAFPKPILSSL